MSAADLTVVLRASVPRLPSIASVVKALIKVGYGCNENCTFCHTADVRHLDDAGR